MLNRFIAIVLLLAFLGQTFSNSIIYLGYYIDKTNYAKNCINKYRPKLNCNGQCQLMKKIQEQEKREQQAPERKLEFKAEVLSSRSSYAVLRPVFTSPSKRDFYHSNTGTPVDQPSSVFHPPCV
jgi:hypothetical protein